MNATPENISLEDIFGPAISVYTRAQAIEDGELVDVSEGITPCPFKYPVAMSRAAYEATLAAGGQWCPGDQIDEDKDAEYLRLPGGQDSQGRLHDVFTCLLHAMRRQTGPTDRIWFSVLIDVHGNGRHNKVDLYSVCGPGDSMEPVITIMMCGED